MLSWIRDKFGPVMVGGIIGFIAFVFVFFGIYNPKFGGLDGAAAAAGIVNGDSISYGDFNREYSRRVEMFKSFGGGKLTEAQIKAFRIKEAVFQDLVNRKLMLQEARRVGLEASDEEIRDRIREMSVFQKDGKFDTVTYKRVLEANNLTPGSYEKLVRDDLALQQWSRYFRGRARVSEEELRREFIHANDKRNIKYVVLTPDTAKKAIQVSDDEVKKFLADSAKANLARSQYDARKEREFKGKDFEAVKAQITREILAGEKTEEIRKLNERLLEQVVAAMTADKASDAKVNAILKPYGVEVRSTGLVQRQGIYLPNAGQIPELANDAFAKKSPIVPSDGGKAKKYSSASWWVAAVVSEVQKPDLAKLEGERERLLKSIASRKERELYDAWLKQLTAKAKIERNEQILGEDGARPQGG